MNGNIQLTALAQSGPVFLLVLARVASFVAALPGITGAPMMVRVMAAVSISAVLFPVVTVPSPPLETVALTAGMVGEAVVGLVIGLGVRVLFAAIEMGSHLMGLQMGLGIANVFDPLSSQQESLIGRLQSMMAVVLFFAVNAHQIVLRALANSFERIPPLGFMMTGALADRVIRLGGDIFLLAVMISVPVTIVMLLTNAALGILSRVIPQLHLFLITFPVTISLGLMVVGVSLSLSAGLLQGRLEGLGGSLDGLIAAMGRP